MCRFGLRVRARCPRRGRPVLGPPLAILARRPPALGSGPCRFTFAWPCLAGGALARGGGQQQDRLPAAQARVRGAPTLPTGRTMISGQPKPEIRVAVRRAVPVAARGTHMPRDAVPAAAPEDPERALMGTYGIYDSRTTIGTKGVMAPLQYVAESVMQTPCIGAACLHASSACLCVWVLLLGPVC